MGSNKVCSMKNIFFRSLAVALLSLFVSQSIFAQADPAKGEQLFKGNCASCHNKNMKAPSTGPALGAVEERWAEFPKEDLYSWIRNSQGLIAAGHPRATKLYAEWNKSNMSAFPALSNDDIDNILLYINNVYTAGCANPPCADAAAATGEDGTKTGVTTKDNNTLFFFILLGFLVALAIVLARIISNLSYLDKVKAGDVSAKKMTIKDILLDKKFIAALIFGVVVLGGFFLVNGAINLNRQQGYQPDQPIAFSHKLHAGENKIDCQYCHDGARRSKHSVIPATNTCMNCHKAIKYQHAYEDDAVKKLASKKELSKVYASAGFDPIANEYVDLATVDKDSMLLSFATHLLGDEVKKELNLTTLTKANVAKVQKVMNDKLGKVYVDQLISMMGEPIKWIRIHNLPDHAYFNHAQHVTVGKVECQQCHGKVEEMEVVAQHSPLSMGWCINCHRQTGVQFDDNGYYSKDAGYYEKYHDQLSKGDIDKVTVEMIGGLECQKCHY